MVYNVDFVACFEISGNHAAALALAAKQRGIPAYIVIPKNAPKCKVENVIRYGGKVVWSESTIQSREETASKVVEETSATLVHPYNDGRILRYHFSTLCLCLVDRLAPHVFLLWKFRINLFPKCWSCTHLVFSLVSIAL